MIRRRAAACIALAALAACRPSAHGRCARDSDCRTGATCAPEGICVAISPAVTFTVQTQPEVAGWYSRSGADLEINAQVTRDGTDPVSAVVVFPDCAAAVCSFPGGVAPGGTFTFSIPRAVQAAGSAALLPFQVVVTDRAGNVGAAAGALQIDDAPPAIGAVTPLTAGILGEDGNAWFPGGPAAPPLEIAVPVADPGAGLASVALHVDGADVKKGTPLNPPPIAAPDGTVHFQLPADGMRAEGPLHFSLVASDVLGHTTTMLVSSVLVDAVGPSVTAPHVDYANAQPAGVCDASPSLTCGRDASHLLRDDTAELTFDVTDCGVGTSSAAAVVTNGKTVPAVETGNDVSTCANGNRTHHFKATVNFADAAPSLPASDAGGTVLVQVDGTAADLLQNTGTGTAAAGATTGDGLALISLWRWKRQLAGPATGSPVLLPGSAGTRVVAIGTANAVTALAPDGSQVWNTPVPAPAGVGTDLALGPGGTIYAVSPRGSCSSSCSGTVTLISSSGVATSCNSIPGVSFGTPPAVTTASGSEAIVVAATARSITAMNNLFVFQACQSYGNSFTPGGADPTGVSATPSRIFVSHPGGFTTLDQNGTSFQLVTAAFNAQVPVLSAPAVIGLQGAVLNSVTTDNRIYRAIYTSQCSGAPPCWVTDPAFTATQAGASLPFTPLFDGTNIYAADVQGTVYAWEQLTGKKVWSQGLGGVVAPPSLLHDGSLLLMRSDGSVSIVAQSGVTTLLTARPFSGILPAAPAVDSRGSYGVAYAIDGAGWVYALQLPSTPEPATSSVWPRPGRDSCNSRNSGSACQ